jgi:DNA helicase-2/ATP-dependent DNA helicase PcrA
VQSGVRFFEQAHIKDVISYLRLIVNPRDEIAWKRVLKMISGIGNATSNRIWSQLAMAENPLALVKKEDFSAAPKRGSGWQNFVRLLTELTVDETRNIPSKQIEIVLENGYIEHLESNYENAEARLEDLKQLALYARNYETTEQFLAELALLSTENFQKPLAGEDVVSGGEEDELLTLTSVHQAKGLEWKAVFIIWAADGKFPSPRSLRETEGEEEERRLWYVALTRAANELYITYPQLVVDYSRQTVLQKPSRFVTEVPADLYEIWSLEEDADDLPKSSELIEDVTDKFLN